MNQHPYSRLDIYLHMWRHRRSSPPPPPPTPPHGPDPSEDLEYIIPANNDLSPDADEIHLDDGESYHEDAEESSDHDGTNGIPPIINGVPPNTQASDGSLRTGTLTRMTRGHRRRTAFGNHEDREMANGPLTNGALTNGTGSHGETASMSGTSNHNDRPGPSQRASEGANSTPSSQASSSLPQPPRKTIRRRSPIVDRNSTPLNPTLTGGRTIGDVLGRLRNMAELQHAFPAAEPFVGPIVGQPVRPSPRPSTQPSRGPSREPSGRPSTEPSRGPSRGPSAGPPVGPSAGPPAEQPAGQPAGQPSGQPAVADPPQQPEESSPAPSHLLTDPFARTFADLRQLAHPGAIIVGDVDGPADNSQERYAVEGRIDRRTRMGVRFRRRSLDVFGLWRIQPGGPPVVAFEDIRFVGPFARLGSVRDELREVVERERNPDESNRPTQESNPGE